MSPKSPTATLQILAIVQAITCDLRLALGDFESHIRSSRINQRFLNLPIPRLIPLPISGFQPLNGVSARSDPIWVSAQSPPAMPHSGRTLASLTLVLRFSVQGGPAGYRIPGGFAPSDLASRAEGTGPRVDRDRMNGSDAARIEWRQASVGACGAGPFPDRRGAGVCFGQRVEPPGGGPWPRKRLRTVDRARRKS